MSHTVTKNTKHTDKMKTKTLLIAAAALAATVISSQAQVYSGVVGYISVTNAPGQFTLIANALDNGSNTLTSLFPSVPTGSQVQIWNGTSFSVSTKTPTSWSPNSLLAVGQGFFLKINTAQTNTLVGSIDTAIGGTVTNNLTGGVFALIGSPIPFSDTLAGTNINLKLPTGSQVQVWNGAGFSVATKTPTSWSPNLTIQPGQGFFVKTSVNTNFVETMPQ